MKKRIQPICHFSFISYFQDLIQLFLGFLNCGEGWVSRYFAHAGHNLWTNTSAENRASNFSVEQFPLPVTLNLFSVTGAWANRWKCNYTQAALTLQAWEKEIYGEEWPVLRVVLQASSSGVPWTEVEDGMPWVAPPALLFSFPSGSEISDCSPLSCPVLWTTGQKMVATGRFVSKAHFWSK